MKERMGIVEATVTNKGKKGLIRRFAPYFKKYLWILIFDLFCAALTGVATVRLNGSASSGSVQDTTMVSRSFGMMRAS